ncbi:MAG: hypothetical protein AB8B56_12670 [Crocinitomicaceae bacterium]
MKQLLILTFLAVVCVVHAQDEQSNHSRSLRVYSGIPYQRVNSTDNWYIPDYELGFDLNHSIRLSKQFHVSFGAGLNYSQYRTDPYVRTYLTYTYIPVLGIYESSFASDDYERQTLGKLLNVRVPLNIEYMPTGRWRPYAKLGFLLDFEVWNRSTDVYAHTNSPAPVITPFGQGDVTSQNFLLSGSAAVGVKYSRGNMNFLLGITSQMGFYNSEILEKVTLNRLSFGPELTIRKTIPHTNFPHQGKQANDSISNARPSYLYLEIGGSGFLGSLNFEKNMVRNGDWRLNAKIGGGVFYDGYDAYPSLPVGLSWIYGPKHSIELGVDAVPVMGDFSYSYVSPRIGYRGEMGKRFLMRVTATGLWFVDGGGFFVIPGISFGAKL